MAGRINLTVCLYGYISYKLRSEAIRSESHVSLHEKVNSNMTKQSIF